MNPDNELPVEFHQSENDGPFTAMRRAERYIADQGWAVGPSQRAAPRGIIFDDEWIIAKWRNLNAEERAACDAYLIGDGRHGPLVITTLVPA